MGDWSMEITLSMYLSPLTDRWASGRSLVSQKCRFRMRESVWLTNVLLPDPDTPVTQISFPRGKSTSMPFRLFPDAALMEKRNPLPGLRFSGVTICRLPERYMPVIESGLAL